MSMLDEDTLPPNLPPDVRERLLAQGKDGSQNPSDTETSSVEDDEQQPDAPESFESGDVEQVEPVPESEMDSGELSNEDKTWKGRLEQAQKENALLKAQAENNTFLSGKLLEEQERRKQLEAELLAFKQQQQAQAQVQPTTSQTTSALSLSEEEKERLRDEMGDFAAEKHIALMEELAQLKSGGANADVLALKQQFEAQQQAQQARLREEFGKELVKQLPEFQGYVATKNLEFDEFLRNTPVLGYSSAHEKFVDVCQRADVAALPELRLLIDVFEGRKQQAKTVKQGRVPTAPPARGSQAAQPTGKRKATDKERMELDNAKRNGDRALVVELHQKFDFG